MTPLIVIGGGLAVIACARAFRRGMKLTSIAALEEVIGRGPAYVPQCREEQLEALVTSRRLAGAIPASAYREAMTELAARQPQPLDLTELSG